MAGARVRQECLAFSGAAQAGGALGGTFGALGGVPVTLPDFLMTGAPKAAITLTPHAGDGFLIPPRTPHNARDIGPGTGHMLSIYIVEAGQPLASFTGQPDDR